jgi:hypothetical protein
MKTKIYSFAVIIAIAATTLIGCKGKDGEPGAQGPQGQQGNANVQSATFYVNSWTFDTFYYYTTLNYPAITQDIINTGAVLVYSLDNNTISQLPFTFYPSANYSSSVSFEASPSQVKVYVVDSDLTQPNNPGSGTFKVVVMSSRSMLANTNIDFKNYNQVKKAFNLKD